MKGPCEVTWGQHPEGVADVNVTMDYHESY